MGFFNGIKKLIGFNYQAAESTPRRKTSPTSLRSEDDELYSYKRAALVSNTRDLIRNFAAARWAVGMHLDYISTFSFQARNNSDYLDSRIEDLMYWWSQPKNCDIAGRHDLQEMIRLVESGATVDGDSFLIQLSSGHLQAVEGDRIRTPSIGQIDLPEGASVVNGVVVDGYGKALGYCVCQRAANNRVQFERVVPSDYVLQRAYWSRFDQVRGISPIASGLNAFKDVMEASEYSLIKTKIAALFGVKFTRQDGDSLPRSADSTNDDYSIDFGQGSWLLDLNPGDDASIMESQHPAQSTQEYMGLMLGVALKSLDIPRSFYDEAYTNYSGARQALIQYMQSANTKRNALKRILDAITTWKLNTWVASGLLVLPDGITVNDLNWEWVSAGVPWIDPLKEIQADQLGVALGVTSRSILCKEQGRDFVEVAKQLAAEKKVLEELGLYEPISLPTTQIIVDGKQ